ncbi:MAG: HIT domain-containing protein [Spirochaetes bacterium]|nr:HIT domain-containing protein [Spirochaetota bacterium]
MDYFFNFDKISYLKGGRPDGCILCLIAEESVDVERLVVLATAAFVVSVNLYPYNPGHLIVFPKRHIRDLREFDRDERSELDGLVLRCLDALDRTHHPSGYNIGYNMGPAAGASIDHLHLHVIPRYPREIGIAELISGHRVLVEDPRTTQRLLVERFSQDGLQPLPR